MRFYGGGQRNTNNNKNNNEREKNSVVVLLLLLMSHAEWHGNFCIFDDELECSCVCVLGSLKCLRVVPVSINLERKAHVMRVPALKLARQLMQC